MKVQIRLHTPLRMSDLQPGDVFEWRALGAQWHGPCTIVPHPQGNAVATANDESVLVSVWGGDPEVRMYDKDATCMIELSALGPRDWCVLETLTGRRSLDSGKKVCVVSHNGEHSILVRDEAGVASYRNYVGWLVSPCDPPEGHVEKEAPAGAEKPSVSVDPSRWPEDVPAVLLPELEEKLAEQVASKGFDCEASRSLLWSAYKAQALEAAKQRDQVRRRVLIAERTRNLHDESGEGQGAGLEIFHPPITSGPRMHRHELPESQRLNRTRTGR